MRLFNKVVIIGVGLIGGSLGLAIKRKRLSNEVIGVSRRRKTLFLAQKMQAIDRGTQNINVAYEADLVILAAPVSVILSLAPKIFKIVKKDCIVTDVASTKELIVSKLDKLFSCYIGSHPLAGSEKQGVMNANPWMFKDSLCILTPTKNTDKKAQKKIKRLWNEVGAEVVTLSPQLHDKILSFASHLPHINAFSLIEIIPPKFLRFASSGLKDSTRIAASDAGLWSDIFLSNKKNISKAIGLFQKKLSKIKSAITRQDKATLMQILNQARKKRIRL